MLATDYLETTVTASPDRSASPPDRRCPRAWRGASAESKAMGRRHLLILRFAVLNLVAGALLAAAWLKGWVGQVIAGDDTHLVLLITLVFLVGVGECARRLWQTSAELDRVMIGGAAGAGPLRRYRTNMDGGDGHDQAITGAALKLKLAARIAPVRHIANSLVLLGLIGTVLGFIVALSGVDPATAGDVSAIGPMVSTLIGGMSVALYTTLVGAVLNIWLMVNYRLLESGTVRLLTVMLERGARHA